MGGMRLRAFATGGDPIIGGVDVTTLPDGHLACPHCQSPYFEAWVEMTNHRITLGCCRCGHSEKLIFPTDVSLSIFVKDGKWTCFKHTKGENVIIRNGDVLCVGCRDCKSEARVNVKSETNLVLA